MSYTVFKCGLLITCCCLFAAELQGADPTLAERGRTLLQRHCVECHGGRLTRAALNLTSREHLLAGGESGAVFDPAQWEQSRIWQLASHTAEPGMPYKRPKLSADELRTLKDWLQAGAKYDRPIAVDHTEEWWSLKPLQLPTVPVLAGNLQAWPRNPIDQFIAAKWGDLSAPPTAEADRRTWLRRVSIDLIGLPPTPAELTTFLNDDSPSAHEAVVDRLLASPHYGERWARHWMDVVHFAETHGHDQDRPRPHAWPYRDYLIQSLNADKPYARFAQEQIAGDMLWPDDPQGITALGFLAAGPWDESSLRDIRDDTLDRQIARYLDRDDIVTTVATTFLSSTAHCARCHEHKFDPISQVDYFRLQAVFAGVDKSNRPYDADPKIAQQRQTLRQQLASLPDLLASQSALLSEPQLVAEITAFETRAREASQAWRVVPYPTVEAEHGTTYKPQTDGSYLASGPRPDKEITTFTFTLQKPAVTGLRLEVLTAPDLPLQGPGRQDNGNLHLNEITLTVAPEADPAATRTIKLVHPRADFNQADWSIEKALDGNPGTAWGIYPAVGQSHTAVFELAEPLTGNEPLQVTVKLAQIHGGGHLIGRARLSLTSLPAPLPLSVETLPPQVNGLLQIPPPDRSLAQKTQLAAYVLEQRWQRELAALPPQQMVYCASNDFPPDGSFQASPLPRPVHVLKRGDVAQPQAEVGPGGLSCVPGLPAVFELPPGHDEGARRVAFAQWMTASENGLFWRSIVNRVWHYHFGRGLVDTPNDFGRMGATPTHPELLDWLAVTFRDGGGSLKHLQRQIVLSATYRQASRLPLSGTATAAFLTRDADNKLLWRMHGQRMDAETVRDAVLLISGKLDRTAGGPSVKQFIESPGIHVTPNVDYLSFDVNDPVNLRRSVYRFLFRTLPDPFMESLDCADASQSIPARNTSITAIQALALLNNKLVVRQAEHLAERAAAHAPELPAQMQFVSQWIFLRDPTDSEQAVWSTYARKHGLANLCRVLLNTNEFVFVE